MSDHYTVQWLWDERPIGKLFATVAETGIALPDHMIDRLTDDVNVRLRIASYARVIRETRSSDLAKDLTAKAELEVENAADTPR